MRTDRVSRRLAILGGAVLVTGVSGAVFLPSGVSVEVRSLPDGSLATTEHRSSLWQSQHEVALRVLLMVVAFAVVAGLLVRYGGRVGALLVIGVGGLGTFASILTIGIFLAPGASLLAASALVAEADRLERRRLARRPAAPLAPMDPARR